jgi:thymidylate synthase (FAD)
MEKGTVLNVLDHGYVKLVDSMGDDLFPLESARMSTGNPTGVDEKKDDGLRDYLWRHQHTSPFEFNVLALEVQAPIFIVREWMRHRTFSYNEYSQRYAEALDVYYVPEFDRLEGQSKTNAQGSNGLLPATDRVEILAMMKQEQGYQRDTYEHYIGAGLARELARINMPVSNYSKFRVVGNMKNWMHFVKLRIDKGAQYEIRVFAEAILEIMRSLWPKMTDVFEEHTLEAKSFSRTELEILKAMLSHYDIGKDDFNGSVDMRALPPSRQRELFEKLGMV